MKHIQQNLDNPPAGTGDGLPEISAGDYVIINPDVEGTEGYAKRAQEALAEGIVLASSFPIRNGRVLVEFDFPYGEFSVPAEWLMWVGNEFRSGENRNTRDQRPPIPYGTDFRLVDVPPEKAKYVSPKDAELAAARARIAALEAGLREVIELACDELGEWCAVDFMYIPENMEGVYQIWEVAKDALNANTQA